MSSKSAKLGRGPYLLVGRSQLPMLTFQIGVLQVWDWRAIRRVS